MTKDEYIKRMNNPHYKDLRITEAGQGVDYVFVSYRSNSWEKVLCEIVYKLQKEYGLRVYFDKAFASETNVWIEQFQRNMDDPHCKAFLCFFDEGYCSSYATLLELMHAMNPKSKLENRIISINFPIDWDKLDTDAADTGLGVPSAENPAWKEEREAFDFEFNKLMTKTPYQNIDSYYKANQKAPLRVVDCKDIMSIIQPKNKSDYVDSEAFYRQFIVERLQKMNNTDVFEIVDSSGQGSENGNADESEGQSKETVKDTAKSEETMKDTDQTGEAVKRTDQLGEVQKDEDGKYSYTIFQKRYNANMQGQMMYDVFQALTDRHPEKIQKLTGLTCIKPVEAVTDPGKPQAAPKYFRGCEKFRVGDKDYYVGISYGLKEKKAEIRKMFEACGESADNFCILDEASGSGITVAEPVVAADTDGALTEIYQYQNAKIRYDAVAGNFTILAGSRIKAEPTTYRSANQKLMKIYHEAAAAGKIVASGNRTMEVKEDISGCNSASAVAKMVSGNSINGNIVLIEVNTKKTYGELHGGTADSRSSGGSSGGAIDKDHQFGIGGLEDDK